MKLLNLNFYLSLLSLFTIACSPLVDKNLKRRDLVSHKLKYDTASVAMGATTVYLFEDMKYNNNIYKSTKGIDDAKFPWRKIKLVPEAGEIDSTNGKLSITRQWLYRNDHKLKVKATIKHKRKVYKDSVEIKFPKLEKLDVKICDNKIFTSQETAKFCLSTHLSNGKTFNSWSTPGLFFNLKDYFFEIDGEVLSTNQWTIPNYFKEIKTKIPLKVTYKFDSAMVAKDTVNINFKSKIVCNFDGENGLNGSNGEDGSGFGRDGRDGKDGRKGRKAGKVLINALGEIIGKDTLLRIQIIGQEKTTRLILDPKGGQLKVTANGGQGGNGGNGGIGSNGRNGDASKNIPSTNGGKGGRGGDGGDGGDAGTIKIFIDPIFSKFANCITTENKEGQAGKGGNGGSNGKAGTDGASKSILVSILELAVAILPSGSGENGKAGLHGEKGDEVEVEMQDNHIIKIVQREK